MASTDPVDRARDAVQAAEAECRAKGSGPRDEYLKALDGLTTAVEQLHRSTDAQRGSESR